jgi:hypothetical protein
MMTSSEDLARTHALVQSFLALSERMRRHYSARVEEFELTPPQAHLLRELAPGPRPMGELAGRLACDASNVTGLTDRLEARAWSSAGRLRGPTGQGARAHRRGQRVQRALWERLMTDSPVTTGPVARAAVDAARDAPAARRRPTPGRPP